MTQSRDKVASARDASRAQRVYRQGVKAAIEVIGKTQKQVIADSDLSSETYLSETLSWRQKECGVSLEYFWKLCNALDARPQQVWTWGEERVEMQDRLELEQQIEELRTKRLHLEERQLYDDIVEAAEALRDPALRQRLIDTLAEQQAQQHAEQQAEQQKEAESA
ncbi:MAG: hypothetical protein AAGD06_28540 [Acidobacteriota bacterium]